MITRKFCTGDSNQEEAGVQRTLSEWGASERPTSGQAEEELRDDERLTSNPSLGAFYYSSLSQPLIIPMFKNVQKHRLIGQSFICVLKGIFRI